LNAGDEPYRFPVDLTGLTPQESSVPGTGPDDPALVPAHGWVLLA
jgi:cyclomaltodextrinase / maltogenic alpha-amylase / neopullulanase